MKISASFLSDISKMDELLSSSIDYLHCDIMDGKFVTNNTRFFEILERIRSNIHIPLDVHLMVEDTLSYISLYSSLNPEFITVHYEVNNTIALIEDIKARNIKVGLSIKPDTDISQIVQFLKDIDLILIMSVEPGLGGQEFIKESVDKINFLKKYREENNLNFLIEVDGGINSETIKYVKDADIAVVGSYLTNSKNIADDVLKLKEL